MEWVFGLTGDNSKIATCILSNSKAFCHHLSGWFWGSTMTMMNISLPEIMKEFGVSRLDAGQYGSLRTDSFQQKLPFRVQWHRGYLKFGSLLNSILRSHKNGYARKNRLVISAKNPKTKRLDEEDIWVELLGWRRMAQSWIISSFTPMDKYS